MKPYHCAACGLNVLKAACLVTLVGESGTQGGTQAIPLTLGAFLGA